jgi:phage terminase large subunit-like protein
VWIPDEDWMKCKCAEIDLSGQVCYGGLDLASAGDTNSLALVFPQAEGFCLKVWYWIPEAAVKRKKTVAAYEIWVRNGHIKINEGNIIDHRVMLEDIAALNQQYKIHSIAYDRWIAYHGVVQGLLNMGIDVFEFGQGYQSMSEPTKSLYNNV